MTKKGEVGLKLVSVQKKLAKGVQLAAVSKFHTSETIMEAYEAGQQIFAESRPQELAAKFQELPKDIQWHFIGHLQTNKIKMIVPFVTLIHSIDSPRLLEAIDQAARNAGVTVDVLLQIHIATEESKQGFSADELLDLQPTLNSYKNIQVRGLMAMATYTADTKQIREEFMQARTMFDTLKANSGEQFDTLSMGMSGDYEIAMECGATIVRVGSTIFGGR